MYSKMLEMKKGMAGMMQDNGMMKNDETKEHVTYNGRMSEMMHDMESGKMRPQQMSEMSKMMGDMSAMMKQISEGCRGMQKTQYSGPKLEVRDDDPRDINLTKQGFPL
jgi:hypothetical protein